MNEITAKSILNKTKRRDPWFLDDYTVNPYRGCSFNCLFCYIRGSKYGIHMERKLGVKINAPELLEKALKLRASKGDHGVIVLASATDPYLQLEKETKLTRQLLEIILKYRFPVHMITRSDLILRDMDLIEQIDKAAILPKDLTGLDRGAMVTFSFSTLDDHVGKIFEPGATPPTKRLDTLQKFSASGFLTGVSMMPLLPWISDTTESLELMFKSYKESGAHYCMPADLTLFGNEASNSKTLVLKAIEKHYPQLLTKYQGYFSQSNEMPKHYRKAFYEKMAELGKRYSLRNRIVKN
ncbi:radical SAM protein [Roseivirga sp. E12]|uniref:SPL family radical SAM protein n=1 Tax=Roseivirga sp. E12 TaxID=2819237 RepID=UPI001ABC782B|nr:radical SAM protein [Roseivirga sp. E12]MBO3697958.1 radical SAM protein [Roseivirga sp. E12]